MDPLPTHPSASGTESIKNVHSFIHVVELPSPSSSSIGHPRSSSPEAPACATSFLCRWTRFDGFLRVFACAVPCPHLHRHRRPALLPLRCRLRRGSLLLILGACAISFRWYSTVSDLVPFRDGGGLATRASGGSGGGCHCGVRCGVLRQACANRGVAAMADTERERMAVVEERGASLEVLSARGFNAVATDCSKPLVHDSSKLLPCETAKEEDIAAMRSCIAAADSLGMKTLQHIVESLETRLQSALMHAVMQILENLGKDAAARVVMAERKASVMEQEHINTKQQALAMMLRIKHSSDSMLIDAEKRLLVEKRRSQELDAKVGTLQDTIRRMKAELKKKGDILDELQRTQPEAAARPGLMSPSEAVSKKRKGNPQVRPSEGKPGQSSDGPVEDECDDTATLLAVVSTRSLSTDRPNSVLGRGLGQSTHRNSTVQEYNRGAPANNKQGSPASLRKSPRDGSALKTSGHRDKELNLSAGCAAERKMIAVESKRKRAKVADVEDDSSDQHDSSVEGLSQNAEKKPNSRHDSLVNGEDMDGIDDGFLGLIALQRASPIPSTSQELQNGDSAPGAEGKEKDASDSSTDDEAEYQSKQKNAARVTQPKSDEGTARHKVPETTKGEQPVVLRRSSGRIRRGKQRLSPEISGPAVKEKEVKASGDTKGAENSASAKSKGCAADAADGSSAPLVESSRDSRRLMQGARQLLSLRKV